MCEIIAVNPNSIDNATAVNMAAIMFSEQGDGLGVAAVFDDGEKFTYDVYKSINPHWATLSNFMQRARDNDVWRFIIHARYGTGGGVNRTNCHPIRVETEQSDIEWVIHNGTVTGSKYKRDRHIKDGHTYTSPVDSEVIAHEIKNIPSEIDELPVGSNLRGTLNYLLLSEDRILIHNDRSKYALSDDFTMTCRRKIDWGGDNSVEWMLVTPGGNTISKEKEVKNYTQNRGTYWPTYSPSGSSGNSTKGTQTQSSTGTSTVSKKEEIIERDGVKRCYFNNRQDTLTITFEDKMPNSDKRSVYKITENECIVISDDDDETVTTVKKSEHEELFKYLVGELNSSDTDVDGGDEEVDEEIIEDAEGFDLDADVPPVEESLNPARFGGGFKVGDHIPEREINKIERKYPEVSLAPAAGGGAVVYEVVRSGKLE